MEAQGAEKQTTNCVGQGCWLWHVQLLQHPSVHLLRGNDWHLLLGRTL
jgi:hypothetical protein